jgi:hypothetical protein
MNRQEFGQFVMAMRTYYNKEKLVPNDQAMELWYMQLSDIPYDIACEMLNRWVQVEKWSPTIADIRKESNGIAFTRRILELQEERYKLIQTDKKGEGIHGRDQARIDDQKVHSVPD